MPVISVDKIICQINYINITELRQWSNKPSQARPVSVVAVGYTKLNKLTRVFIETPQSRTACLNIKSLATTKKDLKNLKNRHRHGLFLSSNDAEYRVPVGHCGCGLVAALFLCLEPQSLQHTNTEKNLHNFVKKNRINK